MTRIVVICHQHRVFFNGPESPNLHLLKVFNMGHLVSNVVNFVRLSCTKTRGCLHIFCCPLNKAVIFGLPYLNSMKSSLFGVLRPLPLAFSPLGSKDLQINSLK